jgi:outer membrane protein assembly factor BamB
MFAALLTAASLAVSSIHAAPAGGHDWTRFGWNAARSNASTAPTGITAGNVRSLRRQQVRLDGTVDSSPIYLHAVAVGGATHDVFFVTTTYGKTEAIDAASGEVLWRFTPPDYSSYAGSAQITTATPVADPSRTAIYASAPSGRIFKLAVGDGHALWSTAITLLPSREKIAASLNFANGRVIATTGGYYGDAPPYQGHVAILAAAPGRLLHVWNSLCSERHRLIAPSSCPASDSAIWGRAGAVVEPGSGRLLVATGNAPWNGRTNWGDSALELSPDATRLTGNYTPTNTEQLNASDADLGSTSPAWLGNGMVAQGGKDGRIRLLGLGRMRKPGAHRGGELSMVSTPSGADLFTAPAVWHSGGRTWLFAADNGGTAAYLVRNSRLVVAWRNGSGGTSPVLAAGLLYVYGPDGGLRVYAPTSGHLLTTLPAGRGHWNSPIVVDGRIAEPEGNANDHATTGVLDIYRLP